MDLSPPQRQQELRDGLSALLASHATSEGDARDSSEPGDDPGLWPDFVSGGWVTVGFPEASGGRGGGIGDLVVVAETLGGGHVATPFQGGIVLCGQALLATPGEGDRLRALLRGSAPSPTATGKGSRPGCETTDRGGHRDRERVGARRVGSLRPVRGRRRRAPRPGRCAGGADALRRAGFFVGPHHPAGADGRGDRYSHVGFSRVEVDEAQVVGQVGRAMQWLPRVLDIGRVVLAAEMVGAAAAALSHATSWATTRVQFNAPIGSLQAVQHRLADAYIDVVTAQDSVYDAAGLIDRGEEARVAAAEAKAYCADACRRVTAAAHQMCGGEGIYADQPLHWWHRRVAALVPVLGSVRYLQAIVAASVLSD
jgi:alkylation response protein AidB-like acyl-CoA dehydrogenase